MKIGIRSGLVIGFGLGLACKGMPTLGAELYARQGGEYAVAGTLPGDQVKASLSTGPNGGFLAWQDNITDGDGAGISAARLDAQLFTPYGAFRVNQNAAGDQTSPSVVMLADGRALFAWLSGAPSRQSVIARIASADGTFAGGEFAVSPSSQPDARDPVACALSDGSLVIAWSAMAADTTLQDVFFQKLSSDGAKVGEVVRGNQYTAYNQRNVAIAGLTGGGFILGWISEQQRASLSVDFIARIFKPDGTPQQAEFIVNTTYSPCASPTLEGLPDGGWVAAWSANRPIGRLPQEQTTVTPPEEGLGAIPAGWDVWARVAGPNGNAVVKPLLINSTTAGDQYNPRILVRNDNLIIFWASSNGKRLGDSVYTRVFDKAGVSLQDEIVVSQSKPLTQTFPAVAADASGGLVAVWSSYVNLSRGVELVAQRFATTGVELPPPASPVVTPISPNRLSVTWPFVNGFDVVSYEVQFDDAQVISTTNNFLQSPLCVPGSEHSVRLSYTIASGQTSPRSERVVALTWGEDANGDGLPDNWQSQFWGNDPAQWPLPSDDADGDGVSSAREFLAGTSPVDSGSVLRLAIESTSQGRRLTWNSQPGFVYQIENSMDFKQWTRSGMPRFAAETQDSIPVSDDADAAYFRVVRVR